MEAGGKKLLSQLPLLPPLLPIKIMRKQKKQTEKYTTTELAK